jgi:hypothetical protein
MFTTSIVKCLKKKPNTCKNISPVSSTWNLFFKLSQILGLIEVFASSLKKRDYNNLVFEVHANKNEEIMYPKNHLLIQPFI